MIADVKSCRGKPNKILFETIKDDQVVISLTTVIALSRSIWCPKIHVRDPDGWEIMVCCCCLWLRLHVILLVKFKYTIYSLWSGGSRRHIVKHF